MANWLDCKADQQPKVIIMTFCHIARWFSYKVVLRAGADRMISQLSNGSQVFLQCRQVVRYDFTWHSQPPAVGSQTTSDMADSQGSDDDGYVLQLNGQLT